MRLIDAEAMPCHNCPVIYSCDGCKEYEKWLNTPTYDVDEVVKELKAKKNKDGYIEIGTAIEIVKKGGAE